MKLLPDDDLSSYPIIYGQCSNEYLILDVSIDDDIKKYFNSFNMYHRSVGGPSNEYIVNWQNWFLPPQIENSAYNYILSPDCNVCEDNHKRQLYGEKTVYMMTGTMFGCFWILKGEHNYDEDYGSYQCYYPKVYGNNGNDNGNADNINQVGDLPKYELNDDSSIDDWDHSGVCAFNVRSADLDVPFTDHDACTVDYSNVE